MALTIVNEEVEQLARELASQTGEPIPQIILSALQERAGRLQRQRSEVSAIARIRQARERCAELPDHDRSSAEDILGYSSEGAFDPW
ncbi:type II toxin-antitoxin system VapB family antitoxin [Thiorhodococcus minor]|uniref:Type II toxin-antitoxin system VapB family antitoxin n=1 Tax=Thiorhodococcus minor TaxID=57489 RepID=A0A6M0JUL5_9GAMM|nr:type II toxin-antitoxin system VapB family antitoxin [Thiorhodococcus minor]NEV60611.1 type II toxin-antitoxin system VapB family antitoxin [Thiorhodococcus minor]